MSDPGEALQIAVVARLLAATGVTSIVADTDEGRAVFAGDNFDDVYPRVTIETPQVLPRPAGCVNGSECFVTLHSWAKGDDNTLIAGRLAGAIRTSLEDASLTLSGHQAVRSYFESSRPVGDPAEGIAHVVSVFRVTTTPAA